MSSFLRPTTQHLLSRGLGQFEVLGPLLTLATAGVGAYLKKEEARRAQLAADREAQYARQVAAAEAIQAQQQADAAASAQILGLSTTSITSSPTNLALAGAVALGALYFFTRR